MHCTTIALTALSLAALALSAAPCAAQGRRAAPTEDEIAARAKAARFDQANAGVGEFQGKKMSLTPSDLSHVKSLDDLKAGQVVGLLQNGAEGDETGLPPGKYTLFLVEVDGKWRAYAEADGKIVREAIRAGVLEGGAQVGSKPVFREKGWCFDIRIFFMPYRICF